MSPLLRRFLCIRGFWMVKNESYVPLVLILFVSIAALILLDRITAVQVPNSPYECVYYAYSPIAGLPLMKGFANESDAHQFWQAHQGYTTCYGQVSLFEGSNVTTRGEISNRWADPAGFCNVCLIDWSGECTKWCGCIQRSVEIQMSTVTFCQDILSYSLRNESLEVVIRAYAEQKAVNLTISFPKPYGSANGLVETLGENGERCLVITYPMEVTGRNCVQAIPIG